jgi:predicted TIM-barrel fold metal-dependent hydrolase
MLKQQGIAGLARAIRVSVLGMGLVGLAACDQAAPSQAPAAGAAEVQTYSMEDFASVRKFDAHVHANTADSALIDQAIADNFQVLSINVDYPAFPPVPQQHADALALAKAQPGHFHWAATFTMQGYGTEGWLPRVDGELTAAVAEGAKAVKVWKNIGMVERDADGKLLSIDDPGLAPVATRIGQLGVPLIAHQGEPHNCWLPLEEMTTDNDREYFSNHPEYHMHKQPQMPGYEDLMAARDRFFSAHPEVTMVGAHLASLEYDVERLGRFLDQYPEATVDMAARMAQVQYQSARDHEKVRQFFIRYADRLLYGTDLTQAPDSDPAQFRQVAHETWLSDWKYLATDQSQHVATLRADIKGLALPRDVIDRIYFVNAARVFKLETAAE